MTQPTFTAEPDSFGVMSVHRRGVWLPLGSAKLLYPMLMETKQLQPLARELADVIRIVEEANHA